MRHLRVTWLGALCAVLLAFLYAPLVLAVVYAFNSEPNLSWPPQGVSLRWFDAIFSDPAFRDALRLSVEAACATALLAGSIGTAAAVVFTRRRSRVARAFEGLGLLPVMLPPLFIAIGLVAAMKATAVTPSLTTIVLGHTVVAAAVRDRGRGCPAAGVRRGARGRRARPRLRAAADASPDHPPILLPAVLGCCCWPSRSRSTRSW